MPCSAIYPSCIYYNIVKTLGQSGLWLLSIPNTIKHRAEIRILVAYHCADPAA